MKTAPNEKKEWQDSGDYLGQCRKVFNILEQWDGCKWRQVPDVPDRRNNQAPSLHFGPDEPNNPYAGDEAFLPRHK